ncbi:Transcription termination factor mitochondrial/chloroplastic [Arabidopsis suecica]|uniref:Transcription termination factor mitochondrial/chloroplastic n=1 Tax=Arabidopsis suecica TaxID=45249 RepID=A0A8T1YLK6_ARASU|nr:Transcription termination factor mitochondrial/chloroplastic [Arabidopsis suecica]
MLLCREQRRVHKLLNMISNLNNCIAFSSIPRQNPVQRSDLSRVSFTLRSFQIESCLRKDKSELQQHSSHLPTRFFVNPVSRASRNQAQEALFDYLHYTRSFTFTDAEHISKNSPCFMSTLLSKIDDNQKDVSRGLTKFLRYNPINEFEPFFESLGLCPYEFETFLPQKLMFLSDDCIMFENFHALCNYGIPRGKIGRMYKEAREIFRYEAGLLAMKLRDYENLGLSKATVIKLVTSCPLLLVGGIDAEFASVVDKLKGLQVGCDWLGRYLSDRKTYSWRRILETIEFLDKVGCKDEKLSSLLKTYPALVIEGSGKKFYVLFGRLFKVGLQVNEIYRLFIDNPEMLSDKCVKNIQKTLDFLIAIRMETQFITKILLSHMELIGSCSLPAPRTACLSLNVRQDELCQLLKKEPLRLFSFVSTTKKRKSKPLSEDSRKYLEKTAFLLRLGYVENSDEMVKALKQFRGRGDQLQERFDCLVKAGLNHNVVTEIIRHAPMILNLSKDVIEKKIHSLTELLGYPIESLVRFPAYLCYDMQRIHHRFSMYLWLRERDAAKPMLSPSTILTCGDARFVKYFVNVHPEGPAIWESINQSST